MIRLETFRGARVNRYSVYVDDVLWCATSNDEDGLKLQIAVAVWDLQKRVDKKPSEKDQVVYSNGRRG